MKHSTRAAVLAVPVGALTAALLWTTDTPGSATPGQGFTSTTLARGTMDVTSGILFKGGTDVVVARNTIDPGGQSGWHSHPGGAIIVVMQGTVTLFRVRGGQVCAPTTYQAGQTFFERPHQVVDAFNTGNGQAIVFVTFPSVPAGGSPRLDQPDPGAC